MKYTKIGILATLLSVFTYLVYCNIINSPEEWQTKKQCKECDELEDGKLQNLKGTVEISKDSIMVFTEIKSQKKYTLIPCDKNCENKMHTWFQKIGIVDFSNNVPLHFEIEGKTNENKQELIYLSSLLIN
ncbi:hypothetical protein ACFFLS_04840 [Flavobacterium procerum]|uniref:Lipoprotein n=1 Tax=Flavobacterium procerum TaxID=1455569 RepID=A0ABV6BLN2_9FLAO